LYFNQKVEFVQVRDATNSDYNRKRKTVFYALDVCGF